MDTCPTADAIHDLATSLCTIGVGLTVVLFGIGVAITILGRIVANK